VIDLGGKIVCPGFIDVQFNGAFGFDFSNPPQNLPEYLKALQRLNRDLAKTGVTSYLPTITSQRPEVYQQSLPYLGPSGEARRPDDGAESLGAHCEGPFLNPTKHGIHNVAVLQIAVHGAESLKACYGEANLKRGPDGSRPVVRMITAAPELSNIAAAIPEITKQDIIFSIGHTECTYEEASRAIDQGATMITHLFNAMRPLHHRNPGIFGLLGKTKHRPYFGIIADGIHLHPTTVKLAWNAHPEGMILVTDALSFTGLPDGIYDWTNGEKIEKKGLTLMSAATGTIAGGASTLMDCVTNFLNWSGCSIPEAIKSVTLTPAKMLGLERSKGCLDAGADADLLVLEPSVDQGGKRQLKVDQVWKFGKLIYQA
jgi:N-acetylglucosamine-6-phosphate deacetylase